MFTALTGTIYSTVEGGLRGSRMLVCNIGLQGGYGCSFKRIEGKKWSRGSVLERDDPTQLL